MQKENKIFAAIIIGAAVIGAFVYTGLTSLQPEAPVIPAKAGIQSFGAESQIASSPRQDGAPRNDEKSPSNIKTPSCGAAENSIVTKVLDGDTVVVEGGYHVRLLGIDADEKGYPCYDAAKNRLEQLILNKNVKLEKDKTDVDQYGRCLRTIFFNNQNIDLQLVKEGLAVARFYEPDVKYKNEIAAAEAEAISGKVGCKWQ